MFHNWDFYPLRTGRQAATRFESDLNGAKSHQSSDIKYIWTRIVSDRTHRRHNIEIKISHRGADYLVSSSNPVGSWYRLTSITPFAYRYHLSHILSQKLKNYSRVILEHESSLLHSNGIIEAIIPCTHTFVDVLDPFIGDGSHGLKRVPRIWTWLQMMESSNNWLWTNCWLSEYHAKRTGTLA